jgi:tetratricopeptide (TPR) repeat protein
VSEEKGQCWSRQGVCHALGLTERQLQSWERQNLIKPAAEYSFQDIAALRLLVSLRRKGIPAVRIRKALTAIRKMAGGGGDSFTDFKVFTDGKRIGIQVAGQKLEPVSGQLLMDFDSAEMHRMLAFPRKAETLQARKAEGDHWFQQALEMEQQQAPVEEIVVAYRKAIELNPECAGAWVNLGTIYFHGRRWKDAETCYVRAVETDPAYALAHFNLGNLYDESGDRSRALFHYHAALQLDPNYSDAHYNIALLLQSTGQNMRAVRHWQIYLKLDPASSWADIARRQLAALTEATVFEGKRGGS